MYNMAENSGDWNDYSKLVLKELERLNESHEKMREDIDEKFSELNQKLAEIKGGKVASHATWIDRVNDVWSPNQMKEAKDELYKQKNRWAAAIAIVTFVQILMGIIISLWGKLH